MNNYIDRKPQEINLQSDAFESMRNNLDLAIYEVINKIYKRSLKAAI